jgi:hypothetical protein
LTIIILLKCHGYFRGSLDIVGKTFAMAVVLFGKWGKNEISTGKFHPKNQHSGGHGVTALPSPYQRENLC